MGLKLTLSLMPPYATLNTPAHRQQYAGFSRWSFRIRPICGRHQHPTQNPPPAAGHCTLDPENACDHVPLIRFVRRPLLGGDICAAREWAFSSFLRSSRINNIASNDGHTGVTWGKGGTRGQVSTYICTLFLLYLRVWVSLHHRPRKRCHGHHSHSQLRSAV